MSWSSRSAFSVLLTLIGLHCFTVLGGSTQQIVDDHNNAADLVLSLGVHHVGIASSAQQRNNDAPTTLAAEDHFFVYSAHAIECSNDSDDDLATSTLTTFRALPTLPSRVQQQQGYESIDKVCAFSPVEQPFRRMRSVLCMPRSAGASLTDEISFCRGTIQHRAGFASTAVMTLLLYSPQPFGKHLPYCI